LLSSTNSFTSILYGLLEIGGVLGSNSIMNSMSRSSGIPDNSSRNTFGLKLWAEMKREMRGRLVPKHYRPDLFDKLQNLRQENLSMEDYYREMEKAMIKANVFEDEKQSIACFMSDLHCNIQRIVEFQQHRNLIELVHQASKAERQ
jgi:hypothetical protein